jgi:hypothetical protein
MDLSLLSNSIVENHRSLPKSKFVIEDLPEVTPLARRNLEETCPTELQTGRIKVQDHDLFTTQPINGLDVVYVFRYIL